MFMKVSVWDTYVKSREDDKVMHFDILVPGSLTDVNQILTYGRQYLESKPFTSDKLSTNECRFCHMQSVPEHIEKEIRSKGYHIIEMENCA